MYLYYRLTSYRYKFLLTLLYVDNIINLIKNSIISNEILGVTKNAHFINFINHNGLFILFSITYNIDTEQIMYYYIINYNHIILIII